MTATIPDTQRAVQLVGSEQLAFTTTKQVHPPGPYQILCQVEAVGLCFSDIKLLNQFDDHARKSDVVSGIDPAALLEMPMYVPNEEATVPGHETVVDVIAAGDEVTQFKIGDRLLVQADFRWLKTNGSNSAFGYNFEGGLQEYVLLDERVVITPDQDSTLIPVDVSLSASGSALVEPFACVEAAYVVRERQTLKPGGNLLVIAGHPDALAVVPDFLASQPDPSEVTWVGSDAPKSLKVTKTGSIADLPDEHFDDVLFFGVGGEALETAFKKTASSGLVVVIQCGQKFDGEVVCPLGRIHYGNVRIVGSPDSSPCDALNRIPKTGDLRHGERIEIVGAGGPMGTIHVIRNLSSGLNGIDVVGTELDEKRFLAMKALGDSLAKETGVSFTAVRADTPPEGPFTYIAIMVPVPGLIAGAIADSAEGGRINIFAGVPVTVEHPIDLNTYIDRGLYFIGTSGSDIEDMEIVLDKVTAGSLNTNLLVGAVSGLDGAVDGIDAVKNQLISGKILVYPSCHGLPLTPLDQLADRHPEVVEKLRDGIWTQEAEEALLAAYKGAS